MSGRVDVLIAGAGVLGSSIAWALAQRGICDVWVVDVDLPHRRAPVLHARPVRATWQQEVNGRATRATLGFFREHAAEVGLRAHGHVWLHETPPDAALSDRGEELEVWSGSDLGKRFPALDRAAEEIAGASFAPNDGCVDPGGVRELFRRRASDSGVRFLDGQYLHGLETSQREPATRRLERIDVLRLPPGPRPTQATDVAELLTRHAVPAGAEACADSIRPGIVINALGPWASVFTARLGPLPLTFPAPRSLAVLSLEGRAHETPTAEWPSLVSDSSGAFFFPDSAYLVAGLDAAERPGFDLRYAGATYFENRLWPYLAQRASAFERVHHLRGLCALDAVTPDGSGILGWLPGFSNVLEAYGFPGSGLHHCFAIARGLAELIVDGRYETLDLSPLSRERFASNARLAERSRI